MTQNKSKILITGGSGMLGSSLKKIIINAEVLDGRSKLDFCKNSQVYDFFQNKYFDSIIHTAAFTDLKYCESYPDKANILHAEIVNFLQTKCNKLIYISTNPSKSNKIYYKTKRQGEKNALKRQKDLVIRTNIFGNKGLVEWALKKIKTDKIIYGYTDVKFNPVHVDQLSNYILNNMNKDSGIINVDQIKLFQNMILSNLLLKN